MIEGLLGGGLDKLEGYGSRKRRLKMSRTLAIMKSWGVDFVKPRLGFTQPKLDKNMLVELLEILIV